MRAITNRPGDNTARQYTFHEHDTVDYAATIAVPTLEAVNEQDVYFAQLTGAATVNAGASIANLVKGDRVNFIFTADGTARTVTWGTGILAPTATRQVAINGGMVVTAIFNGTALVIGIS